MMKGAVIILLIALVFVVAWSPIFSGPDWQKNTAGQKQEVLNGEIKKNTKPYGWYTALHMAELFTEDMAPSFSTVSDEMPGQGLLNAEERPKLIHSVGAIGEIKFETVPNTNLTGILDTGSTHGFIRFSLAAKPEKSPPTTVPGISLKFMRTGIPSANLFAMYGLTGQPSFNFFEHDLTNHVPDIDPNNKNVPFSQKKLYQLFQKQSKWPTCLGISQLANGYENGTKVEAPKIPFRLVFHPYSNIRNMFPSEYQKGNDYYIAQMEKLPLGPIYDVYAEYVPNAPLTKVGTISLTSKASGSKFGDKDLFFQHTKMESDLALRPDWVKPLDVILANQRAHFNYHYPDLPFN